MLKEAANALGNSEECLMFRHKQAATFINGKQKSSYGNKSPTTEILPLELLFFPLLQEIQTNILLAYVHIDILSIVA